jgi:hypothetical protein
MSNYISEQEKKQILAQIANLQSMLASESDSNRRQELINSINGLRARLEFGANPDRGM